MSAEPFEDAAPHRPLWLMTLADLALLLLGFLVLVQATAPQQRAALAKGLRGGFGSVEQAEPIQVAANGITGFAQGSAVLPAGQAALTGWARDAVRDPRVRLIVTGSAGWERRCRCRDRQRDDPGRGPGTKRGGIARIDRAARADDDHHRHGAGTTRGERGDALYRGP